VAEERRRQQAEEPAAALAEYVSRSFQFAERVRYIDHSGEYALAYFLARQIEESYGVSFLREALDLKLELSMYAPSRRMPLRARLLEIISRGMSTIRVMTNVVQNIRRRRVEEEEWGV